MQVGNANFMPSLVVSLGMWVSAETSVVVQAAVQKKAAPDCGGGEEGRYLQPYLTVTATTVDCVMFADVAVTVTFVVPTGVAGVLGVLPHPTIRMAEANNMTTTPRIRMLANCLRRRKASSDPNGSIIAEATAKRLRELGPANAAAT